MRVCLCSHTPLKKKKKLRRYYSCLLLFITGKNKTWKWCLFCSILLKSCKATHLAGDRKQKAVQKWVRHASRGHVWVIMCSPLQLGGTGSWWCKLTFRCSVLSASVLESGESPVFLLSPVWSADPRQGWVGGEGRRKSGLPRWSKSINSSSSHKPHTLGVLWIYYFFFYFHFCSSSVSFLRRVGVLVMRLVPGPHGWGLNEALCGLPFKAVSTI